MIPEALGSFYLGRTVDPSSGADAGELLLYDSRDLTTHAVCVGMTGSGKTGLCLSLLEEAAIDGIPAIVIDPKGDLGNLALTFPRLRPEDFAPWVDAGEAARKNMTPEAYAAATAESWRTGLAQSDQDIDRIQRLRDAAAVTIYTPGSAVGQPLSVLRSFAAPAPELRGNASALRERVGTTVAGLLGLVGVEADPLKSREHILLATILDAAWSAGRDLDLVALIHAIQKPPFEKVGVFDLETFYPAKERTELAMALNNLIASPGFATWMQGDALDIQQLLFDAHGKPRIAVVSIAHLNDAERMFVVSLLLGEIVAWMRRQSGTSSLRALVYMDEIFGYFPPSAMPPSKLPLLTLMKQARAFGLGVVLATQNPVDLDYKGLSNAGTWFIGRLQTERDKARVIDGLLSAGSEGLDKQELAALLANLGNRVFLMRNVHDDAPVLFRTRWALSYLRGPLTLQEIARLKGAPGPDASAVLEPSQARAAESGTAARSAETGASSSAKPLVPPNVPEFYWRTDGAVGRYKPRVYAAARVHYVDKAAGLDAWETRSYIAPLDAATSQPDWRNADVGGDVSEKLSKQAGVAARYEDTPAALLREQSYRTWERQLEAHIYESAAMELLRCPLVGANAVPAGDEREFRAHLALALREQRDAEIDKLRRKYAPRLATLQDQQRRAQERIARERSQLSQQKMSTAISVGTSLLGALLGRRTVSSSLGRVGSAARDAGRIGRESEDVQRAEQTHEELQQRQAELESELEQEVAALRAKYDPANAPVEKLSIKPRKADIEIGTLGLLWVPAA